MRKCKVLQRDVQYVFRNLDYKAMIVVESILGRLSWSFSKNTVNTAYISLHRGMLESYKREIEFIRDRL